MLSRSQIDKLGERLKASSEVEPDDLTMLQELRTGHDAAMLAVAHTLIDELGMEPGTRLKTVGTIVDKLRRESIRLSQMQDIAGVRLVADMSLSQQGGLVEMIMGLFPGSKVVDRRTAPSHGYRAVHVIVEVERRYVEVQVRTEWQHLWAQVFETAADVVGRPIRYGLPPTIERLPSGGFVAEFVEAWLQASDSMRGLEEFEATSEAGRDDRRYREKRAANLSLGRAILGFVSSVRPLDT